jgi:hypothetical protein
MNDREAAASDIVDEEAMAGFRKSIEMSDILPGPMKA